MGLYLYLDTSISGYCLGILERKDSRVSVLAFEVMEERKSTARSLSKSFEELRKTNQFNMKDFEGVVCAIGPGTFTGLRIGLAWVYGLFGLSNVDFFQTSTTELLAKKLGRKVLLPATKDKGYLSTPNVPSIAVQLSEPRSEQLLSVATEKYCHIEWKTLKDTLGKEIQDLIEIPPIHAMQKALEYFCESLNRGELDSYRTTSFPLPNYIRLSTAEERLQQQAPKK